jgi:hypothetical protein
MDDLFDGENGVRDHVHYVLDNCYRFLSVIKGLSCGPGPGILLRWWRVAKERKARRKKKRMN